MTGKVRLTDDGRAPGAERRLWREHPGARRAVHAAVLLSALAACAWFGFAVLLAAVAGRVFLGGAALPAVAVTLVAMLALVAARAGLLWAGEVVVQRAAEEVKGSLRARVVARLVALGPAYTVGERAGELVHTAGGAIEELDASITGYRRARLLAGIVPVLAAILVLALDPWAAAILLLSWPVLVVLLALIGGRVRERAQARERELAWMSAHFLDVLRGLPTLKLFGRSAEQATTIEAVGGRFGATTMDVLRTAFQASLVLEWGATGATALVAIEASVRLMGGGLGFDHALAALLMAPEFFLPMRRYAAEYHTGQAGRAAAARVYALLDEPDRTPAGSRGAAENPAGSLTPMHPISGFGSCGARSRISMRSLRSSSPQPDLGHLAAKSLGQVSGRAPGRGAPPDRLDLRFDGVWVAHDAGRRPALAGFSLEVPEGATVALVGATGAGKSTVAGVLLRFVEPDAGSVLVGGVPLAAVEPERWRALVAYVPQQPWLFHGTVSDNIRLARPGAADREVVAAARAAHAHEFVSGLPAAYETPVGEGGARLSGGERQRIAIARAVLRDAPLLVLDEATSHLDPETEGLVLEALARLARGRTVLQIAHRPELARAADLIAVMHAGRVVEVRRP